MQATSQWLFGVNPLIPIALAAVGLVVLLIGLTRAIKPGRVAGIVILLLGGAWLTASLLVETLREAAVQRTNAIVEAYDGEDWPGLALLIDPETTFDGLFEGPQIARAAEATHGALAHDDVGVASEEVTQDEAGVRVVIDVVSYQAGPVPRIRTTWAFDYQDRDGRIVLTRITPLSGDQVPAERIRQMVVRP